MAIENQDPQDPIADQPPPKQYAYAHPRTVEPGRRESQKDQPFEDDDPEAVDGSSEGDDENTTAAEQNADYRDSNGRSGN